MAERGTLSRGLGYGTLTFGLSSALSVVSSVLTARLFGIDVVGQFALVMAPATAVAVLSTVREQPALVRKLAGTRPGDPVVTGLFGAVFAFSFILTLATSVVGIGVTWLAFHGPINHPDLFAPAAAGLAGYLLIDNTGWNLDYVFAAFMASESLLRVRVAQGFLFAVAAAGLSFVRISVWSLVVAYYGSSAVATLYRLWRIRTIMPYRLTKAARQQGRRELPDILRFGLKIMPGFLAIGISNQAGTWIVGATSPVASVGAFSRASTVTGKLGDLNFRITEMLFPALVTRRHQGDTAGFDRAVLDTLRYVLIGLLAPAAVIGGAAAGILDVFGPGFQRAAFALPILALVPAAMSATAVLAHTMFALNRTNSTTALAGLRLIVTVVGGVVLSKVDGIDGMAAALALGAVAQFIAQAVLTLPQLATPLRQLFPWRQALGLVVAYISGFACARAASLALPGPAGLPEALATGFVGYAAGFLAVGGLVDRDRQRAQTAWDGVVDRLSLYPSAAGSRSGGWARGSSLRGPSTATAGVDLRPPELALRRAIRFACLALAPVIVWARPIAHALLGGNDAHAAVAVAVLAPAIFFALLAPLMMAVANEVAPAPRRVSIVVWTLAMLAGSAYLLRTRFGVVGMAVGIDVGFYTVACLWLNRGRSPSRLGPLVWSLASSLTAAAAMAIVLVSVGVTHLTGARVLTGGSGALAAYLGMLIFTGEIGLTNLAGLASGHVAHQPVGPTPRAPVRVDPARRARPPAAEPPPWLEQLLLGGAEPTDVWRLERPQPSPAAEPPAWVRELSTRSEAPSVSKPDHQFAASDDVAPPTSHALNGFARTEPRPPRPVQTIYEIDWRSCDGDCVFELRQAKPRRDDQPAAAIEQSPHAPWGWRMAPAPTPDVRAAHSALVDKLLGDGWQHVGSGEAWFSDRFESPPTRPVPVGPEE